MKVAPRPAIVTALAVMAAGCGGAAKDTGSCASTLRFWGHEYRGTVMTVPRGPEVGEGIEPGCGGKDRRLRILALEGVPPAVAVARAGGREDMVYSAVGFFPVLRGHPLHRALVERAGELSRPRDCSGLRRVSGRVVRTPFGDTIEIEGGGRRSEVTVVPDTRITGFQRAGEPYLAAEDRVVATGRRCRVAEGRATVAERIAPLR